MSGVCDVVFSGGQVVRPSKGVVERVNVGVKAGSIESISSEAVQGCRDIDISGAVLAPGFIDLQVQGQCLEFDRIKAYDGVTSVVNSEEGVIDVGAWYAAREDCAYINYGTSVGHSKVRQSLFDSAATSAVKPHGKGATAALSYTDGNKMRDRLERGLQRGAVGVGMGLQYTPGVTQEELRMVATVASAARAPLFVHLEGMGKGEGGAVDAFCNIHSVAEKVGCDVFVCHVHSSGLDDTENLLSHIAEGNANDGTVLGGVYPYTSTFTSAASEIFSKTWRKKSDSEYSDLFNVETEKWLNEERFRKARDCGHYVIADVIDDEDEIVGVLGDRTVVTSDGRMEDGRVYHPRSAGSFARFLRKYVVERREFSLVEAIEKISYTPARFLEKRIPSMRSKGRIQEGKDADLVVLDVDRIVDNASYANPGKTSSGVDWLMVNGVIVVEDGEFVGDSQAGSPVRADS